MIINPNLYIGIDRKQISPVNANYNFYKIFCKDIGCELGHEYTLSFDCEQTSNGSGKITILSLDKNNDDIRQYSCNIGKRQSITFIYGLNSVDRINIYSDIMGQTDNIGLEVFNFKLEKGKEETIYNPNINNLEPSKQAIFVAGGGIQGSVSTLSLKLVEIDQLYLGVGYVS